MAELRISIHALLLRLIKVIFLIILSSQFIRARVLSAIIAKASQSQKLNEAFLNINLGLKRVWNSGVDESEVAGERNFALLEQAAGTSPSQDYAVGSFQQVVHPRWGTHYNFCRLQAEKVAANGKGSGGAKVKGKWENAFMRNDTRASPIDQGHRNLGEVKAEEFDTMPGDPFV